jgi:hypothetical protein
MTAPAMNDNDINDDGGIHPAMSEALGVEVLKGVKEVESEAQRNTWGNSQSLLRS